MRSQRLFTPWIPPILPVRIREEFMKHGKRNIIPRKKMVHDELKEPDPLSMVISGVLSHGVINDELEKPIAISLIPPERMTGWSTFFSRIRMPAKTAALEKAELISVSYAKLYNIIINDTELLNIFSQYQEKGNKTDLYGMLSIMTVSVEERFKMLCASTMIANSFNFEQNPLNTWYTLPYRFTRQNIAHIVYASNVSIDRLLARWTKEGALKRDGQYYSVIPEKIISAYNWILERS